MYDNMVEVGNTVMLLRDTKFICEKTTRVVKRGTRFTVIRLWDNGISAKEIDGPTEKNSLLLNGTYAIVFIPPEPNNNEATTCQSETKMETVKV